MISDPMAKTGVSSGEVGGTYNETEVEVEGATGIEAETKVELIIESVV